MTDVEINTSSGNTKRKDPLSERLSPKGGFFIRQEKKILSKAYRPKICEVTFEVTSYDNPAGTQTSQEMLLQMMEQKMHRERR